MWIFAASIALLLLAAAAVSYPLLRHRLEPYDLPDLPDDDFNERDALLEALSDLEESRLAGKLSAEDYAAQKERLQRRYIMVVESGESGA
jgi:cytochrome c-type biogenesis protein CcmI